MALAAAGLHPLQTGRVWLHAGMAHLHRLPVGRGGHQWSTLSLAGLADQLDLSHAHCPSTAVCCTY